MPVETSIRLRKGTGTEWNNTNPVLASGEPGYDLTNKILKIGDGVNTWSQLSNHNHTTNNIADFNSSVSGLLPVKDIIAGSNISITSSSGTFTINSTGGGLTDIVQDTSPQLGGNLDLNGYHISGVSFYTSATGTIIGPGGWIYQSGQAIRSEGFFNSLGDSQSSQFILRASSTDANWTTLKNNDNTAILLASNRTFAFNSYIVARSLTSSKNAAYKLEGLLYNDGYGASIIGTPIKTIIGEDDTSWDVRVAISGSGAGGTDYLLTQVSGSNSTTINWVAKVDLLEVGGNHNSYEFNILQISNDFIP